MTLARFCHYIDGRFEEGRIASIDPSTGKPWAVMPAATEADVDRAVEAARAFHAQWAGLTATQRDFYRLADLLAENAPTLAKLETADTGKIIRETSEPDRLHGRVLPLLRRPRR